MSGYPAGPASDWQRSGSPFADETCRECEHQNCYCEADNARWLEDTKPCPNCDEDGGQVPEWNEELGLTTWLTCPVCDGEQRIPKTPRTNQRRQA